MGQNSSLYILSTTFCIIMREQSGGLSSMEQHNISGLSQLLLQRHKDVSAVISCNGPFLHFPVERASLEDTWLCQAWYSCTGSLQKYF